MGDFKAEMDRNTRQELSTSVGSLNDRIQLAVSQGYEVRIRVEEGKSGIPRVRFTLHRQIGAS